jgi:hypothetical protein
MVRSAVSPNTKTVFALPSNLTSLYPKFIVNCRGTGLLTTIFLRRRDKMKRGLLAVSFFFMILTFIGIGYVFSTNGQANAGYAIIPMLLALVSLTAYRLHKHNS